jgi:hypothetical protein
MQVDGAWSPALQSDGNAAEGVGMAVAETVVVGFECPQKVASFRVLIRSASGSELWGRTLGERSDALGSRRVTVMEMVLAEILILFCAS